MENTPLLDSNASGIYKRVIIRLKKIISNPKEIYCYLFRVVYQARLSNIHTSLTSVIIPHLDHNILTVPSYMLFLEGCHPTSSSEEMLVISLHLDSMI